MSHVSRRCSEPCRLSRACASSACYFEQVHKALSSARSSPSFAIPGSTLSHHLERLKAQGLVAARRDARFLWYAANTQALEELLRFLFDECCSRSHALKPGLKLCK